MNAGYLGRPTDLPGPAPGSRKGFTPDGVTRSFAPGRLDSDEMRAYGKRVPYGSRRCIV